MHGIKHKISTIIKKAENKNVSYKCITKYLIKVKWNMPIRQLVSSWHNDHGFRLTTESAQVWLPASPRNNCEELSPSSVIWFWTLWLRIWQKLQIAYYSVNNQVIYGPTPVSRIVFLYIIIFFAINSEFVSPKSAKNRLHLSSSVLQAA